MKRRFDPSSRAAHPINWIQAGLRYARADPFELVGALPGRPRLAIVGSRAAHRRVLRALPPLVEAAGLRGWTLVSGGAIGVDGAAHQAALGLGLPQLAVLPCGRDRVYPPGHAGLFGAMAAAPEAGLLFAHPPGTVPSRAMFFSRNEIVIGLADAVLVAEASLRSGSRKTGGLALTRGRPLAALAGSSGCAALIGAGARALPRPTDPPDPTDPTDPELVAAFGAWLDRCGARDTQDEPPSCAASRWPAKLAWLVPLLQSAGPAGANLDALPDPSAALVALTEAELLGLASEATPGRWVALVVD